MSKLLTTTTRSLPLRLLLFRRGTSSSPISTLSSSGGGGDGSGDGGGSNPTTWPTQQTQLRALPLLAQSCHAIRLSSSSGTPTLSLFMLKSPPRYYSTTSKAPEPRKWSFEEVKEQLNKSESERIIIDLREPSELADTGRIPTAHSLPLNTNPEGIFLPAQEFHDRFGFPKPGSTKKKEPAGPAGNNKEVVQEVIFYCRAGVRSKAAARLASGEGGWEGVKVGDMRGGWVEWAEKGGPVDREKVRK